MKRAAAVATALTTPSSRIAAAQEAFFRAPARPIAHGSEVFSQRETTVSREMDLGAKGVWGRGHDLEVGVCVDGLDFQRTHDRGAQLVVVETPADDALGLPRC